MMDKQIIGMDWDVRIDVWMSIGESKRECRMRADKWMKEYLSAGCERILEIVIWG